MVQSPDVGRLYVMEAPLSLKRWCICSLILQVGESVLVSGRPSPNRLEILAESGGYHKVRRSTFRMVVRIATVADASRFELSYRKRYASDVLIASDIWRAKFLGLEE